MTQPKTIARLTGLAYVLRALLSVVPMVLLAAPTMLAEVRIPVMLFALLGAAVAHALGGLGCWRLFRTVYPAAAAGVALCGLAYLAVTLLTTDWSVPALAATIEVASAPTGFDPGLPGPWVAAGTLVAQVWLIPLGYLIASSGYMPRALGYLLVAAGLCNAASAGIALAQVQTSAALGAALGLPVAAGTSWLVGYLVFVGVRSGSGPPASARDHAGTSV